MQNSKATCQAPARQHTRQHITRQPRQRNSTGTRQLDSYSTRRRMESALTGSTGTRQARQGWTGKASTAPRQRALELDLNPLSKLFRNCLKTEIESLKRISRVFERNGAFFFRYRARVREPRCSRSGRFGRSRPYESAPTSSRSQAWLFAPAQRR